MIRKADAVLGLAVIVGRNDGFGQKREQRSMSSQQLHVSPVKVCHSNVPLLEQIRSSIQMSSLKAKYSASS